MAKAVLIAGGAGFIGSYLCDYYISKDYKVTCVDNLSTSTGENIKHLKNNKNFIFLKHDIINLLPNDITTQDFEIVLNLASPASPPKYQRLAIETLKVGSQGTLNLLEIANNSKARFFHASTSEVYGDPEVHPQTERYWGKVHCYGPRSMYDESKRYAEALIFAYRQKYNISTAIGRFFNTYGPRMDIRDGRVVSNFIVQALLNKPITVYGKGKQTRSFCYVDDLIKGITKLIDSDEEGPINLGNPTEFTIQELAEKVIFKTNSRSNIINLQLPVDDPIQRKPDITLATKKLKWSPEIDLDLGLDNTITFFEEQLKQHTSKMTLDLPKPLS